MGHNVDVTLDFTTRVVRDAAPVVLPCCESRRFGHCVLCRPVRYCSPAIDNAAVCR